MRTLPTGNCEVLSITGCGLLNNKSPKSRVRGRVRSSKVAILCLVALALLSPVLAAWYLTAELFDSSEYITSSVVGPADVATKKPRSLPPRIETVFLCGSVTLAGCGRPVGDVTLSINDQAITTSDGNGHFEFVSAPAPTPSAISPGTIILTASGTNLRTKVMRLAREWINQRSARLALGRTDPGCPRFDFSVSSVIESECGQRARFDTIDAADSTAGLLTDEDRDGIDDVVEDWLAERFAPIVYHGESETSYPVTVDWWLARTSLSVVDQRGLRKRMVTGPVTQSVLTEQLLCASEEHGLSSELTRSREKEVTYYLENVTPQVRNGQQDDPAAWVTYVHSFSNVIGGVTIQYWRGYTWNDANVSLFDFSHGGDWEGIAVHLNSLLKPEEVSFLDHSGITHEKENVQWEGTHPRVWSEEGGHSSRPDARKMRSSRFISQEAWTSGRVVWWDGSVRGTSGGLVNIGERTNPRNGQTFVKYAGLWGAPRRLFLTSGYWGPAFNETAAECADGTDAYGPGLSHRAESVSCGRIFIRAWCDDMNGHLLDLSLECYPARESR